MVQFVALTGLSMYNGELDEIKYLFTVAHLVVILLLRGIACIPLFTYLEAGGAMQGVVYFSEVFILTFNRQ